MGVPPCQAVTCTDRLRRRSLLSPEPFTSMVCRRDPDTFAAPPRKPSYIQVRRSSTSARCIRRCALPWSRRRPCHTRGPSPSCYGLHRIILLLEAVFHLIDAYPRIVVIDVDLLARNVDIHGSHARNGRQRIRDRPLTVFAGDIGNVQNGACHIGVLPGALDNSDGAEHAGGVVAGHV